MAITARDIHEMEFAHAMRGYKESDVDDFLDLCAAEVDRLTRENNALYAKLEHAKENLSVVSEAVPVAVAIPQVEMTEVHVSRVSAAEVGDILLVAQNTADDLLAKAHSQAERIVNAAEGRASEIVGEAAARKREIIDVAKILKQEEVNFRQSYRSLLEASLASITEIRMDIDPEAEVSIVPPVEYRDSTPLNNPPRFDDEPLEAVAIEEPLVAEVATVEAVPVEVAEEKSAPFDPGILEKTSFIGQVEFDDDFEIEEIG
jgi:cell division initiation protein